MEEQEEIDESPLDKSDAKLFRGVAARRNYMGPDRPNMQYVIKELSRCMANPRQCDWRLLTYRPKMVLRYAWQKRPSCLDGYTDSDMGRLYEVQEVDIGRRRHGGSARH